MMGPTCKLRFIERAVPYYPGSINGEMRNILQQWWEPAPIVVKDNTITKNDADGEWRDVPIVTE
jgi:hypothetical protein